MGKCSAKATGKEASSPALHAMSSQTWQKVGTNQRGLIFTVSSKTVDLTSTGYHSCQQYELPLVQKVPEKIMAEWSCGDYQVPHPGCHRKTMCFHPGQLKAGRVYYRKEHCRLKLFHIFFH